MTHRLDLTIEQREDSETLVTEILKVILNPTGSDRCAFLVPAGKARLYVARVRVMISRKRKTMIANGRKPKRFTLSSSVHPETHEGIRHDCIVMWQQRHDSHMLAEMLEDIIGKEAA